MSDPLESLEAFYADCESAHPTRMLPDPAVNSRRIVRALLGRCAYAIGPLFVGAAFGLLLLMLGANFQHQIAEPAPNPFLDKQIREAGIQNEEPFQWPDARQDRTEGPSWRA